MECLNKQCDAINIENDDNFCYKCGQYTSKGYSFLKDDNNKNFIINGNLAKKNNKFSFIIIITILSFCILVLLCILNGDNIFKPAFYLKKRIDSYIYGYNVSFIKTDNIYAKQIINSEIDAKDIIKQDLELQSWKCGNNIDVLRLQDQLENNYDITSVSFCDISLDESKKIVNVINKMFDLFPKMKGSLTNISITNSNTKEEYIARFQPMYQFVNPNEDINEYNKVNKTQILLNSYYFLNQDFLNNSISSLSGSDWYVNGATWDSTIAHELGHYISFYLLLKEYNVDNVILVTKENEDKINELINIINNDEFSKKIVYEAIKNYNLNNNLEINENEFSSNISKYANLKNDNGDIIYDETIAEAIHDYYLNGNNANRCSLEIVKIIKNRLGEV